MQIESNLESISHSEFEIDVPSALKLLQITQPRLSQLTSRGSLNAVRKKIGGRRKLFYKYAELVQFAEDSGIEVLDNRARSYFAETSPNPASKSAPACHSNAQNRILSEEGIFSKQRQKTVFNTLAILKNSPRTSNQTSALQVKNSRVQKLESSLQVSSFKNSLIELKNELKKENIELKRTINLLKLSIQKQETTCTLLQAKIKQSEQKYSKANNIVKNAKGSEPKKPRTVRKKSSLARNFSRVKVNKTNHKKV
jgi:hypothetical protein